MAWAAFAAALLYAGAYFSAMGLVIVVFVMGFAAVALFTRQRTGPFPYFIVMMLVLFAAGAFTTRVDASLLIRSGEVLDILPMLLLMISVVLACEESLRRFGYRIDSTRPFEMTIPTPSSKTWSTQGLMFLLSMSLIAAILLVMLASGYGGGNGLVRLGIYAWALGAALLLARTARAFIGARHGGRIAARMTLLEVSWLALRAPLHLTLKIGGIKRQ
jgi:hypothetical protein